MTTKPKTRKAPASSINPKLIALAAKIDEAKAYSDSLYANDQEDPADDVARAADNKTLNLEKRLAKIAATTLEELKLKARYVYTDSDVPSLILASRNRSSATFSRSAASPSRRRHG